MGSGHRTDKDRFLAVLKINFTMFVGELIVGLYSGSWVMLSDSFHLFLDTLAPLVSYLSEFNIFGLSESKIKKIAARISLALFFVAAGVVIVEALSRIAEPPELKINIWFFLIAMVGLVGNFYSFLILKKEGDQKVSYIRKLLSVHMLVDAGGSIVVIASGLGVLVWQLFILDPILSLILAGLIILSSFLLMKEG